MGAIDKFRAVFGDMDIRSVHHNVARLDAARTLTDDRVAILVLPDEADITDPTLDCSPLGGSRCHPRTAVTLLRLCGIGRVLRINRHTMIRGRSWRSDRSIRERDWCRKTPGLLPRPRYQPRANRRSPSTSHFFPTEVSCVIGSLSPLAVKTDLDFSFADYAAAGR